jgi:AcrR family transcriptional regulator
MKSQTATPKRPYQMSARADAKRATRERILEVFGEALRTRWYDELTFAELAREAGVSAPTLTNHFGDKAGLLVAFAHENMHEEISAIRAAAVPGDIPGAISLLLEDYEETGDIVIRMLALEHRLPELAGILAIGRDGHRSWVTRTFEPVLPTVPRARKAAITRLVLATDVYLWQLLRRDMELSRAVTHDHLLAMALAVVASVKENEA